MPLDIFQFPCLDDNYAVLLRDVDTGTVALIDAPDEDAILEAMRHTGWSPDLILITHHHGDHVQAAPAIKAETGAEVLVPAHDVQRIKGADRGLAEGETVMVGATPFTVIATPGHTLGHVAYVSDEAGIAFCGDTLFALGCGRLFEGTAAMMWASLQKLMALPDSTTLYCGHEYTAANARFALSIEPDNAALQAYAESVAGKRDRGEPTVPTTLSREKAANPFLRANRPEMKAALGMEVADDVAIFAEIRARKDRF